jgi:hypothetical protein
MCYLIHLGVPVRSAAAIQSNRLPHVSPARNESVSAAFGPAFALFSVSEGGCACNLYSPPKAGSDDQDRMETRRKKYERLGWSAAKIDRALADSVEARAHAEETKRAGLREDVAIYVADLADRAGEVRLVVHFYHGSFSDEQVPSRTTRTIAAHELRRGLPLAEDTVYIIR